MNSKTRWRPVSRNADHSCLYGCLLPTVVLPSTRLGRTNIDAPVRHGCKGAPSYSPDAYTPPLPPLSLSAREIRYEVYSCIFERLSWIPTDKVSSALLTFSRVPIPLDENLFEIISPRRRRLQRHCGYSARSIIVRVGITVKYVW